MEPRLHPYVTQLTVDAYVAAEPTLPAQGRVRRASEQPRARRRTTPAGGSRTRAACVRLSPRSGHSDVLARLLETVGARLLERGGGPHQLVQRRLHAAQEGRRCASGFRGAGCLTDGRSSGDQVAAVVEELVVGVATGGLGGGRSTHGVSLAAHEGKRNAVEPPYRAGRGDGIVRARRRLRAWSSGRADMQSRPHGRRDPLRAG
jgi:hypothetical protein